MRKSALCRPRALQILELKCKCILERDDRRKSCLMGCTYWCKIMSRAAFDMICTFCNKLQGKQALNKLHAGHETGLRGCSGRCSPQVLPAALATHCHAMHASSLPLTFSSLNRWQHPQNQWRNGEAGSADIPGRRSKNTKC